MAEDIKVIGQNESIQPEEAEGSHRRIETTKDAGSSDS